MQAVFFDCGNTLIEPTPPVGVAYARAMGAAGVEADPDVVQERFVAVFRRLSRVARASGRSRFIKMAK